MIKVEFNLDMEKGSINLLNKDDHDSHQLAAVAAYCILGLTSLHGSTPDEIVADLLRICKGCLKNEA